MDLKKGASFKKEKVNKQTGVDDIDEKNKSVIKSLVVMYDASTSNMSDRLEFLSAGASTQARTGEYINLLIGVCLEHTQISFQLLTPN